MQQIVAKSLIFLGADPIEFLDSQALYCPNISFS